MTIKELRNEANEHFKFEAMAIGEELAEYSKCIWESFETLYKEGYINLNLVPYGDDILALANGYQFRTGNYSTCHISQTFDLKSITANKTATKEMMNLWLNH